MPVLPIRHKRSLDYLDQTRAAEIEVLRLAGDLGLDRRPGFAGALILLYNVFAELTGLSPCREYRRARSADDKAAGDYRLA